ncbi:carotenoid biosynthesis protein [Limnoraphis robusta Tam1]|uniref:Carotenoid biosynthesis protein n=1 Tax=Limnoraphis robusta CCNP1315 TaxID=3110306 RepID=A0ABU5TW12_9CYAN|nr:carotenoid biosynthesis protein [Limnoraphis robusta]MEA5496961.1 carotenoid biosynthesis protein [Limnoraphis robusta BA-68 BA1]MEA5519085.1 carotenoid biosynthesis protein [Limnoraphis robusta CCNP1315]MEA5537736.1 carotenoid biosynthesis protein [Limnoraphis robusta Tam1]MEA5547462.1 carotenoid biosynthesis protein [Limnoraphis robusta CCNP1324]
MKQLIIAERFFLTIHVISTLFGLAGLLIVLPNPQIIANLPAFGQTVFGWSMAGGGVAYIVFGAIAVALYAYRTLGLWATATFMIPAVFLSLGSELLGTSTGFPFGHYQYLSGLGYKIGGLVPFTIPLSWFYMGLTCYLLARTGFKVVVGSSWFRHWAALAMSAILLTAWDLVLDPAMSQAPVKFWEFQEVGEFFGMPYRNLIGWMGTAAVFMSVGAILWRRVPIVLSRPQLTLPLIVYLTNFVFGAAITVFSLDARFLFPVSLSIALGVIPACVFWWTAGGPTLPTVKDLPSEPASVDSPPSDIPRTPAEILAK